uniref:hypothetical protein n=1 Tax=Allorhizocola rhizosphaerae TaxID=1872709 RepID=UPI001B8CF5AF
MTHKPSPISRRWGLLVAASFLVSVVAPTAAGEAASVGPLAGPYGEVSQYNPADYTADSWAAFAASRAAARAESQGAADGLVMVRGLKSLVADYKTRAAARYTGGSWAPFAKALDNAERVAADGSASA